MYKMFFSEKMALMMGIETRAVREFFTIPIWENLQQTFLTHFSKWLG